MFEVKISVSLPCRTSPLKYDASGPCPFSLFCNAIYLYAENAPGCYKRKENPTTPRKNSYQYTDIPKHALRRFIKNTAHLVLKILRRDFTRKKES